MIGLVGMICSCAIGTTLGLLAGYFGGKVDAVIMRIADVQLSFPSMLIALFIMSVFGRGVGKLLIALTMVGWVMQEQSAAKHFPLKKWNMWKQHVPSAFQTVLSL